VNNKSKLKEDCGCDTLVPDCCGGAKREKHTGLEIFGGVESKAGAIPLVGTALKLRDILGSWRMRWGIGRYGYSVEPGIYAVGKPEAASPVFVSANYKMSFDRLRNELKNINGFILVLDTKGINVWCAAGKGTFGTAELIKRIKAVKLNKIVSHRNVILPQLGAPGVAAHLVAKKTGFRPVYGPVEARDIPAFLKKGMKTDERMRKVEFPFKARIVLSPLEITSSFKLLLFIFVLLFLANYLATKGVSLSGTALSLLPYLGAVLTGTVLVPALLPWLPGRSFALKGWLAGLLFTALLGNLFFPGQNVYLVWVLILPAISAFAALNFTGCSTYTSLSGVKKEMKYSIPLIVISALIGIVIFSFSIRKV